MLKYVDTRVCFAEVPDEITLCINISNCPCHCEGCHSSHLAEDIGTELDELEVSYLINSNKGITCIAFMGGDSSPDDIHRLAMFIREVHPDIKVAWYSGREKVYPRVALNLHNYDYIKVGPYMPDRGPLDNPNTNQRFFQIVNGKPIDITHKFWKHETQNKD